MYEPVTQYFGDFKLRSEQQNKITFSTDRKKKCITLVCVYMLKRCVSLYLYFRGLSKKQTWLHRELRSSLGSKMMWRTLAWLLVCVRFYLCSSRSRVLRNSTKMTVLHRLIQKLNGVSNRCLEIFSTLFFIWFYLLIKRSFEDDEN